MGERIRELLTLLLGDVAIFVASLWLTLAVRYLEIPTAERLDLHLGPFLLLSGVWLFVFYVAGMYDKHTNLFRARLVSQIVHTQFINILIAAVAFVSLPLGITPKTNLVIYLVVSIVLITAWRLYLYPRLTPRYTRRAILIADGDEAIELVDEVNNNPRYSYHFLRIIDKKTASDTEDFKTKLLDLIQRERIEVIVADPHSAYIEQVLPDLFRMTFERFEITFLDFYRVYENTFDRIPLTALRYDWFLAHVSQSRNILYDTIKRVIDIVGALFLGAIFVLLLPWIALAMRMEGRGSIFIAQDRLGQYNRHIKVYKLRTMTENQAASSTWTTEDKQHGNTVTRVGAILRKTSLDEVPQVWNIIKGEMSLIGPRNDILGLAERLTQEIPYYAIRNFVKPGVSGWAQTHQHYMGNNISPQSLEETRLRLAYDLYYVKNKSFLLDLEIALRTFKTLLSRFGITLR
jgi:lipopolysaccharide/colanic/teichoic acid biosynthesis glycosyltransferase